MADKKITDLTETFTVVGTDVLPIVIDTGSTPLNRKVEVDTISDYVIDQIVAADIPTGVDAVKIGAGDVSNTEFSYLDGVSAPIQTQLNLKQPALGFTAENVANKDTDTTLAADSDTKYPSQKATKAYADSVSSNASVIAKVLTAFSAGAGTVSSSDSILSAFQKVVGNIALKLTANSPITPATKTKITYDANGLVTSGADIDASDLPSGIDAAKISGGSVSNTEFDYLNGVTSAIQTQIDNKGSGLMNPFVPTGISSKIRHPLAGGLTNDALGNASWSSMTDKVFYVPFLPGKTFSIDRIGYWITTAASGKKVRLGIYSSSGGLPATKLCESGDLDQNVTSFQESTVSLTLNAGTLYFFAIVSNNTSIVGKRLLKRDCPNFFGIDYDNANDYYTILTETLGSGWTSLPSTAGTVTGIATGIDIPMVMVRLS